MEIDILYCNRCHTFVESRQKVINAGICPFCPDCGKELSEEETESMIKFLGKKMYFSALKCD